MKRKREREIERKEGEREREREIKKKRKEERKGKSGRRERKRNIRTIDGRGIHSTRRAMRNRETSLRFITTATDPFIGLNRYNLYN